MKFASACCVVLAVAAAAGAQPTFLADFDDLSLSPQSYWRGDETSDGFTSGSVRFNTNYEYVAEWDMVSWDGFAYSNVVDTTTAGYTNQFAAIPGAGVGGSANYAIGFDPVPGFFGSDRPSLSINGAGDGVTLAGAYFSNATYAYLSMLNGDGFAKQFGGISGDDPDYLLLTITGLHGDGSTDSTEFYLADFRFEDNSQDYIVSQWTWADLSGLGPVVGLEFALSSTDSGQFGMNTPSYFAMDSLMVPEPATLGLLAIGALALRKRRA